MNMPSLRPVLIPTKNKSFWRKTWIWLSKSRLWEVTEDYNFILPSGTEIVIPKGFVMDGASIPRPFWFLLSPVGLLLIAGLIHDYGYRYDCLLIRVGDKLVSYRKGAGKAYWDILFYKINLMVNDIKPVAKVAYWAVKFGGGSSWRNHR